MWESFVDPIVTKKMADAMSARGEIIPKTPTINAITTNWVVTIIENVWRIRPENIDPQEMLGYNFIWNR